MQQVPWYQENLLTFADVNRRVHTCAAGQAVVQFVRQRSDRCEYAVKFFLDRHAFRAEAALYAACTPGVTRRNLQTPGTAEEHTACTPGALGKDVRKSGEDYGATATASCCAPDSHSVGAVVSKFLPQVEAVCDGLEDGGKDVRGQKLPPCIVMEKGESLQDWSDRGESDLYTTIAVCAAALHASS